MKRVLAILMPFLFCGLILKAQSNASDSQIDQVYRNPRSFELGMGLISGDGLITRKWFMDFGMNFKIKNRLYLYPNFRTVLGGIYCPIDGEAEPQVFPILGSYLRYYFFERNNLSPYGTVGLSYIFTIKDESQHYQVKGNGFENVFALGIEFDNFIPNSHINLKTELGYSFLPFMVDTQKAQQWYNAPDLYKNAKRNGGGLFLNCKIGF